MPVEPTMIICPILPTNRKHGEQFPFCACVIQLCEVSASKRIQYQYQIWDRDNDLLPTISLFPISGITYFYLEYVIDIKLQHRHALYFPRIAWFRVLSCDDCRSKSKKSMWIARHEVDTVDKRSPKTFMRRKKKHIYLHLYTFDTHPAICWGCSTNIAFRVSLWINPNQETIIVVSTINFPFLFFWGGWCLLPIVWYCVGVQYIQHRK